MVITDDAEMVTDAIEGLAATCQSRQRLPGDRVRVAVAKCAVAGSGATDSVATSGSGVLATARCFYATIRSPGVALDQNRERRGAWVRRRANESHLQLKE
ncbi:MAG TPA: hypothetical protein VIW24_29100 [Aldersonia sp.]